MIVNSKNVSTTAASSRTRTSHKLVLAAVLFLMMIIGLIVSVPAQAEDPGLSEAERQDQMAMRHREETQNEIRLMQAHGISMGTDQ